MLEGLVPALVALPLIASGAVIGALLVDFEHPRRLDAGERDLLEAIAVQTAVGLERALLYEREHTVAQTLQASLLPARAADDPGPGPRRRALRGRDRDRGRRRLLRRLRDRRGRLGDRDRRRLRQGRRRRRADRALAAHGARRGDRGPPPSDVLRALNRAVLADARTGQFLTAIFARHRGLDAHAGLRRAPAAGPAGGRRARQAAGHQGHAARRPRRPERERSGGRSSSPATRCCSTPTGSPRRARRRAR